jgi:hypothetical protein
MAHAAVNMPPRFIVDSSAESEVRFAFSVVIGCSPALVGDRILLVDVPAAPFLATHSGRSDPTQRSCRETLYYTGLLASNAFIDMQVSGTTIFQACCRSTARVVTGSSPVVRLAST